MTNQSPKMYVDPNNRLIILFEGADRLNGLYGGIESDEIVNRWNRHNNINDAAQAVCDFSGGTPQHKAMLVAKAKAVAHD